MIILYVAICIPIIYLTLCFLNMAVGIEIPIIKNATKNKIIRYFVFIFFILFFNSNKYINFFIDTNNGYEYNNDLMKRSYEIIKGEDGKLYCVMNVAEAVPKVIIAEVKDYNEIILDKPKNIFEPYKGKDITIDLGNLEMIDNNYQFHFVQDFNEVTFENQRFDKVKGKNEVYIYPYVYKIVKETDKNITVKFKGRKKVKFEELVPMVNNEIIPSNYLEFYKGEKSLTVLFD